MRIATLLFMKALLACMLLAAPTLAEVPGGHLYVGAGGSWVVPLPSPGQHVWASPLRKNFALSLELSYEFSHAFVAVAAEYGGLSHTQPEFGLLSVRAGWILGTASIAPYLAAGVGSLNENVESVYDCVGSCIQTGASGPAVLAEAGVLAPRDRRFGRITLAARLIEPLFDIPPPFQIFAPEQNNRLPLFLVTLRLFL